MKKILFSILLLTCVAQSVHGQNYWDTPFRTVPYAGTQIQFEELPYGIERNSSEWDNYYCLPVFVSDVDGNFGIIPELYMYCTDWGDFIEGHILKGPDGLWFNYVIEVFDWPDDCPYTIDEFYKQGNYTIQTNNNLVMKFFSVLGNKTEGNHHIISLSGSQPDVRYLLMHGGSVIEEKIGTGFPLEFSSVWRPGTYTVEAIMTTNPPLSFLMIGNFEVPSQVVLSQIPSEITCSIDNSMIVIPNVLVDTLSGFTCTYGWRVLNSAGYYFTSLSGHNGKSLSISFDEFKTKTYNNFPIQQGA